MESNIDKKMARFVELSKKFTMPEDGIEEIGDLKGMMEPKKIGGVTLTATNGLGITDYVNNSISASEEVKIKSDRERLEDGVTRRWNVWADYKEYLELQKTLSDYFIAKAKV